MIWLQKKSSVAAEIATRFIKTPLIEQKTKSGTEVYSSSGTERGTTKHNSCQ